MHTDRKICIYMFGIDMYNIFQNFVMRVGAVAEVFVYSIIILIDFYIKFRIQTSIHKFLKCFVIRSPRVVETSGI